MDNTLTGLSCWIARAVSSLESCAEGRYINGLSWDFVRVSTWEIICLVTLSAKAEKSFSKISCCDRKCLLPEGEKNCLICPFMIILSKNEKVLDFIFKLF